MNLDRCVGLLVDNGWTDPAAMAARCQVSLQAVEAVLRRRARLADLAAGKIKRQTPKPVSGGRKAVAARERSVVLAALRAAARTGAACPSGTDLARAVGGACNPARANAHVVRLTALGAIEVHGEDCNRRRVRVDGRWTDWTRPARRADRLVTEDETGAVTVCGLPAERFRALHADPALSVSAIAERLGWPRNRVETAARALGLKRPKRPVRAAAEPKASKRPAADDVRRHATGAWSWAGKTVTTAGKIERDAPLKALIRQEREAASVDPAEALADAGGRFGRCQWIEGPSFGRRFCGAETGGMSSWCAEHARRVFRAVSHQPSAVSEEKAEGCLLKADGGA